MTRKARFLSAISRRVYIRSLTIQRRAVPVALTNAYDDNGARIMLQATIDETAGEGKAGQARLLRRLPAAIPGESERLGQRWPDGRLSACGGLFRR
jgi:hypothetical protein